VVEDLRLEFQEERKEVDEGIENQEERKEVAEDLGVVMKAVD